MPNLGFQHIQLRVQPIQIPTAGVDRAPGDRPINDRVPTRFDVGERYPIIIQNLHGVGLARLVALFHPPPRFFVA